MGNKDQYTADQMVKALKEAKGMKTVAAKILGCSFNTVARYVQNYATVKAAMDEAREETGDRVTLTLYDQAFGRIDSKGKQIAPPNIAALIFLAKTQFKDRGYTERIEIVGGLDLNLINETARALTDAGIDAQEFFQKAIERAKQKTDATS